MTLGVVPFGNIEGVGFLNMTGRLFISPDNQTVWTGLSVFDEDGGFGRSGMTAYNLAADEFTFTAIPVGAFRANSIDLSANGRVFAVTDAGDRLPADENGVQDVLLYDTAGSMPVIVSNAVDGFPAREESFNVQLSSDGSKVAFATGATLTPADDPSTFDDIDILIRDLDENTLVDLDDVFGEDIDVTPSDFFGRFVASNDLTRFVLPAERISEIEVLDTVTLERTNLFDQIFPDDNSNGDQVNFEISGDGRFVFVEFATFDLEDPWGLYRYNIDTGEVLMVLDGFRNGPFSVSDDGRYLAISTDRTDLGPLDTNNVADIYVIEVETGAITRVSERNDGGQFNEASLRPTISADGSLVAFTSASSNTGFDPGPFQDRFPDGLYFADGRGRWFSEAGGDNSDIGQGLSPQEAREVALLYEAGLDRDGNIDLPGLNFWIDQREAGLSVLGLAAAFLNSDEFQASAEALLADGTDLTDTNVRDGSVFSNEDYVVLLYENVLDRMFDEPGRDFWLSVLETFETNPNQSATARERLLLAFAESDENRNGSPVVDTLTEASPGEWDFV